MTEHKMTKSDSARIQSSQVPNVILYRHFEKLTFFRRKVEGTCRLRGLRLVHSRLGTVRHRSHRAQLLVLLGVRVLPRRITHLVALPLEALEGNRH